MITRAPRPTSNFYLLDKSISEDKRLSWAARGMLVFLLGKPDDWQVSPAALTKETQDLARSTGRDGVYAILKELRQAGYLQVCDLRDNSGTFGKADYIVTERPDVVSKPHAAQPDTVKPRKAKPPCAAQPDTANPPCAAQPYPAQPYPANPPLLSTDLKQGLKENKGLSIPAAPSARPTLKIQSDVKPAKAPNPDETELQTACRATWSAYAKAYEVRYGTQPVRNQSINSRVKQFVQRIGFDESPGVAAFFVNAINDSFVVRGFHQIGVLLQNAEAYRTQWATGNTMTATRAKQIDQSQANYSVASEAMEIWRAKQRTQNAQ